MPRIPATKVGTTPDGTEVFRPVVIVTILVGDASIQGPAMVDSGADNTLVPAEALAVIGIDFASLPAGSVSVGAGGGLETRPCAGIIRHEQWEICQGFRVAEPGKLDIVLLGRTDFFSKFVVRFHWYKQPPVFDLDPASKGK